MTSSYASHPGLVRQNNEDSIRTDDTLGIYLLADGIGGHNAGEVASALAIDSAYAVMRSNIAHTTVDGYFELMVHAMCVAHWEINSKALSSTSYTRMGTTLVIAVLRENKAYIVHAGDSRCYLFQGGSDPTFSSLKVLESGENNLQRLTNDHTVGELLLANGTSIDQIPKKQFNTLTQSVGCGNPPCPDFTSIELKPDDMLLMCSDGLTDMLTDADIEAILAHNGTSLETLSADLIAAANAHGGKDNVSVVLITP